METSVYATAVSGSSTGNGGRFEGDPTLDVWMFQLGALRQAAMENRPGFTEQMQRAVETSQRLA